MIAVLHDTRKLSTNIKGTPGLRTVLHFPIFLIVGIERLGLNSLLGPGNVLFSDYQYIDYCNEALTTGMQNIYSLSLSTLLFSILNPVCLTKFLSPLGVFSKVTY